MRESELVALRSVQVKTFVFRFEFRAAAAAYLDDFRDIVRVGRPQLLV